MRVVSLLPSATEILAALGLGRELVGVTHGCDYPAGVEQLPRVTRTTIPEDAPSGEVDRLVRERHAAGLPLYELDLALLRTLAPDLVVTQGLCDVCAVSDQSARDAALQLPGTPEVLSLAPRTLADVFGNVLEIGTRTGRRATAEALVAELRARVAAVVAVTGALATRPRVTLLEWTDPPYACGHWTPELVSLAGGLEGHGRPGAPSRRMEWSEVVEWAPEVLVIACCGLDARAAGVELSHLAQRPHFSRLPCAATGRIHLVDGSAYFSRPGPRLVDSLELLAAVLHPERFPRGAPAAPMREPPAAGGVARPG